jgi:hypothetical protein
LVWEQECARESEREEWGRARERERARERQQEEEWGRAREWEREEWGRAQECQRAQVRQQEEWEQEQEREQEQEQEREQEQDRQHHELLLAMHSLLQVVLVLLWLDLLLPSFLEIVMLSAPLREHLWLWH